MENRNDQLIKDFLAENKKEIQDFGFSNRVAMRLPKKKTRRTEWIVPVFAIIGIVVSLLIIDVRGVISEIFHTISSLPYYFLMGGIMVIPIVVLFFYLYYERKNAY